MYRKHFNLEQLPFRNTPDPRFYFQTEKHQEAMANLLYAVEQRRGFVMLTGEIGSGKTLVTHLLLQQIESHALVALVRNTHLNSTQLIRLICDEFSVRVGENSDKASMLLSLNQFLVQQLSEDRLVVVIIDEAQNLSDRVLEELRMLSNLETSTDKLIQIVLVGQPELRDKVSQPQLEQLRTRIALSYHLESLTPAEVRAYIEHRLHVAGPHHRVQFTDEAINKIARFSRGTPRVVNGICDNALLYGFTANKHLIDETLVEKVIRQSMHMAPRQKIGPVRTPSYTHPAAAETYAQSDPEPEPAPAAPAPIPQPRPSTRSTLAAKAPSERTPPQVAQVSEQLDVMAAPAASAPTPPAAEEKVPTVEEIASTPETETVQSPSIGEALQESVPPTASEPAAVTAPVAVESAPVAPAVHHDRHEPQRVWSDSVVTTVPAAALFGLGK